jgi:hypothetical protein
MKTGDPSAEWLGEFPETLLEILGAGGRLPLPELKRRLCARHAAVDFTYGDVLYHLRLLKRLELVRQEGGVYVVTRAGRSYLADEIDPHSLSYDLTRFEGATRSSDRRLR